eukprot:1120985-Prorocentrum_minimum.AAC.1
MRSEYNLLKLAPLAFASRRVGFGRRIPGSLAGGWAAVQAPRWAGWGLGFKSGLPRSCQGVGGQDEPVVDAVEDARRNQKGPQVQLRDAALPRGSRRGSEQGWRGFNGQV